MSAASLAAVLSGCELAPACRAPLITAYFDVTTAQNVELAAKLGLVEIRYRRVNADVLLIKALGGGWNVTDPGTEQAASLRTGAAS